MSQIPLSHPETSVLILAYLDPGTGSFLFQAAIASFFGALYFFRGKLSKVREYLGRSRSEKS